MLNIHLTSEYTLFCTLPPPAELEKQQKLWAFGKAIEPLADCVEVVIGMNNLTVFCRLNSDLAQMREQLFALWETVQVADYQPRLIKIPVHYGGERGEDLYEVAQFHHTTPAEIIKRHTAPTYTVAMIGFQAGFPYLFGLPEHLHTPRRAEPRLSVPAGSVGIGGSQTGIYPFTSPGGWQIIGRTDLALFQADQSPPTLLQAGDSVQFFAESIEV